MSVVTSGSTRRITEPPGPPLPPSGPPSGLNFSRCTDATPCPPRPALTCSDTRSTKVGTAMMPTLSVSRNAGTGVPDAGRPFCDEAWVRASGHSPGTMFTTRRPRRVPNSTAPATSANRVSSPPRPTPLPGWKWVPRWRTMISPALTTWPPYRLTPSRWELESRPFLVDAAPFLCAICSVLRSRQNRRGRSGVDRGDLDLGVLLAVPLALLVAGLVLVLLDDDLGALGGAEDLGGDGGLAELRGVGGDRLAVHDEDHRQGHRVAHLGRDLVDLDDVADGNLLLGGACAHDRVHRGLLRRFRA